MRRDQLAVPPESRTGDFGGIKTADGQSIVKRGLLYRSGHLHKLDLDAAGPGHPVRALKTVVDFREPFERTQMPDNPNTAPRIEHIRVGLRIAATAKTVSESDEGDDGSNYITGFLGKKPVADHKQLLIMNATEVRDAGLIDEMHALVKRVVAEPGPDTPAAKLLRLMLRAADGQPVFPLNMHCTAGKDRCGAAAAIVLLALGVSEADVMSDFLLTNALLYQSSWWMMVKCRALWLLTGQWRSVVRDASDIERLLLVERPALQKAFDTVRAKFGGFTPAYWAKLGLSSDDLAKIRDMLLEPAPREEQLPASARGRTRARRSPVIDKVLAATDAGLISPVVGKKRRDELGLNNKRPSSSSPTASAAVSGILADTHTGILSFRRRQRRSIS